MDQASSRKPAGRLAIVALAAVGALALFAFSPGRGTAVAAPIDDSQAPITFGSHGGDCDWGNNGPPPGHRNDECERDRDGCDRDGGWQGGGWNGPTSAPHRNDDRCDRDRDRDDCDRDWRSWRDSDDCRCDRHSRDRDCRDRDDCRGRNYDYRDRCCDRDYRDRDRCDRRDDSTITIVKQTRPSSNASFSFSGDLGSFSLRDGQSRSFRVDNGTYTVWENADPDYDLTSINCYGDGIVSSSVSQGRVQIRVSNDDNVTCTFYNEGAAKQIVSPYVAPTPVIIYVPVPAPQPVVRAPEPQVVVVREPAPAPRPAQPVAALPRTGEGPDFQREGNYALPLGATAALMLAGIGYVAVRRVRDTE